MGTADSFAIDVFALDGSRLGTVQKQHAERRATSAADIERFKALDTTGRGPGDAEIAAARWRETTFPSTLPPYSALVVDSDDNLWVRTFPTATGRDVTWIVFSPDGTELATIGLPYTLEVNEIGPGHVLGTHTDLENGIKRVRVYRLTRASR